MSYQKTLEQKVREVLNSNQAYFQMLDQWHQRAGGIAIESEVKEFIEKACQPGHRILEAGSGSGTISNWFATRHPCTQFIGVDISRLGSAIAKTKASSNAHFNVADLKCLPFETDTFHFIFSQSVLEHVVGWESAINELFRVLRPNSNCLIRLDNAGVNDASSLYRALVNYLLLRNRVEFETPSFHLRKGNAGWRDHAQNFDVNHIPSDLLLQALKRVGFNITHFSTGTANWRHSSDLRERTVSYLQFWPFNHLGSTTIVVAKKPGSTL